MTRSGKFRDLNPGFFIGFGYGVWQSIMLNYLTYRWFKEPFDPQVFCDPCTRQFGFPAALYEKDRWADAGDIVWLGLTIDAIFAIFCAIIAGLVCNYVWSRVRDGRF